MVVSNSCLNPSPTNSTSSSVRRHRNHPHRSRRSQLNLDNIIEIDTTKKPQCLEDAITMYIDFLVLENEKKTRISTDYIKTDVPITNPHFERERYFHEALQKNIPFPTAKFRNWIKLYGMDIEVGEAEIEEARPPTTCGFPLSTPTGTCGNSTDPLSTPAGTCVNSTDPLQSSISSSFLALSGSSTTAAGESFVASPNLSALTRWSEDMLEASKALHQAERHLKTSALGNADHDDSRDLEMLNVSDAYASEQSFSDSSTDDEIEGSKDMDGGTGDVGRIVSSLLQYRVRVNLDTCPAGKRQVDCEDTEAADTEAAAKRLKLE